jgi:FkbM family methyltransferase
MLILKKFPHYIRTGIMLLIELDNPWSVFGYAFHKEVTMKFSNGLRLSSLQFIDPLIIAETVFYDDYRLRELVEEPKYILDVGAAMGDFSCWCAQLYPKAEIIAFEPNDDEYELLEKNIKANKAKKVKPVKLAVSTKPELTFFVATVNVRSSVVKDEFSTTELKVKATPLDPYINKTVDILKIDCEGAEIDILESIKPHNFKKIKRIVLEYHNHLVKDQDKKLTRMLKKLGFEVQQQADEYNPNIGYLYADQK